jgi:integrase
MSAEIASLVRVSPIWRAEIESFADWLISAGRPPTTTFLRTYQVRRFALAFPSADPWSLTVDDATEWAAAFNWRAETRRSYRAGVMAFYKWGTVTGRVKLNPMAALPTVAVPGGVPKPAPELTIRMALAAADRRTRAMILLGACCGLRRAEIASAHSDNLVMGQLRVLGKGSRTRVIPLSDVVIQALAGLPKGFYFPGNANGHLSAPYVGKLLSRALGEGWTGHTLRHRFASVAYTADRDLRAIQTLLGHSDPQTTARYTAVPDGALRAAVHAARIG